ncbi:MAG: FAD-dependent oxidoreductase [Pseudomonadota bacterium]|nr:NAD(P)/FAD-dependent oxidoreductase [Gammaproteobacteria bacterium]MBU1558539.1 NAD(P)/FAD-dependent oxidoreductase [Gammaproteobacteria bacterium]MBU1629030.1 NAD(P)/FAD-dependent oxidoreductase [Gammaproteobacteria bacterium]MBU1927042.1 NAD(P)/FAD-dependent oxidoreductase [Gammaproteobacteria bacterium]
MKSSYECVVIGGGPAGMAAAVAAKRNGIKDILIIEREKVLGGILNQCIHNGFGVHHFKEELTGPEYSSRMIDLVRAENIESLLDCMVLSVDTKDRTVHAISPEHGYLQIKAKAIVLAMGCRERTRGAIRIYGSRPSGVFTAGTAQRLMNIDGYMPGKKVVILGSGDIGLVMARRLTLEGAKVEMVVELMPYSNGLPRNTVECLYDYNIPLLLSHTVVQIHGKERVTGVTIAKVDENGRPIKETERFVDCDTLLLSVGLIPENEISRGAGVQLDPMTQGAIVGESYQTNVEGIFSCGNVLHVHDVVDFVTEESSVCGEGVARYIAKNLQNEITHKLTPGEGIRSIVPQTINLNNLNEKVKLYMRVKEISEKRAVVASIGDQIIAKKRDIKFLPAQTVTLELKKKDLLTAAGNEVVISVQ